VTSLVILLYLAGMFTFYMFKGIGVPHLINVSGIYFHEKEWRKRLLMWLIFLL
jgi:hypothetical protein